VITAALNGVAVAPVKPSGEHVGTAHALASLSSEIAERLGEMNEIRENAGTDLVLRLSSMARLDRGAFLVVLAVMHGDTSGLTDSYSSRGDAIGCKKQTVHYRTLRQIESIASVFPEVASMLSTLRLSVKHHEDPVSRAQLIRDAVA
jgi:hypothetical protein